MRKKKVLRIANVPIYMNIVLNILKTEMDLRIKI